MTASGWEWRELHTSSLLQEFQAASNSDAETCHVDSQSQRSLIGKSVGRSEERGGGGCRKRQNTQFEYLP